MGGKRLNIEFGAINEQNVEQLRKVNTSCFPVNYNDTFYKDVVAQKSEDLSKFAYVNGFVVGAVCTRVEPLGDDKPGRNRIYIMTLGVLAAYRNRGIGANLISSVLDFHAKYSKHNINVADENFCNNTGSKKVKEELSAIAKMMPTVDEITLHVQTSNEDAMKFYMDKFGFEKGDMVENYYKRIDPPHCYVLFKKLQ
mmetsp:Transcript_30576/g.45236  ORF Transcript_30576/g.45236 Transcript_30576/m.45236 type:complete len:197 (-) Transcript_30576:27-617(-)|eukprot:CAMPEP_0195538784 /NCGR_PEP_ID=MMETSP0794_2-20130614/49716_1 /TAXON_ID=515487 /ORGANISM="Stephanopyxis turris, Strain CCMP 815" /LENGTH=196 /DNA_ID=CAMNT_0040672791 /DNA_START=527 /DNA_END=1117 /DNA_ORIENTATION=-